MDKNKKKITSAFFIMLIIVVLAVTGYYVINKKITQDAAGSIIGLIIVYIIYKNVCKHKGEKCNNIN